MPVKPDSRFASLPMFRVCEPNGTSREVVGLRLELPSSGGNLTRHRLGQGESLDALARHYYGDEGLWWRILDANSLVYPLDLEPGQILDVPAPGPATRVTRARSF